MQRSDVSVGFLVSGAPSEEERAALTFARRVATTVDRVALADVADGSASPSEYDACWWHAHEPVADPRTVAAAAEPIRAFVERGGGLFLSARALAQVAALGIDPVAPDATGTEAVHDPVGPLWKRVYDDHPAVAELDGLRHHMRPAGSEGPYARYESVLPERGDVLASTYRGRDEVPEEVTTVQWRLGEGTVLGVGVGLEFAQHDDETTERNRERFAADALRWLGGAAEFDTALAAGRPKSPAEFARYRARLGGDRDRPSYHLTAPANWLNDPNGLIHHDGRYHVFYQYNPGGPYHHTVHWGHAVSDDLVTWEDRPVALTPDPGGPDRDGCWSGCAFTAPAAGSDVGVEPGGDDPAVESPVGDDPDDEDVYALYTGGREGWQLPCLATATDDALTRFEPVTEDPVIDAPPAELDLLSTHETRAHFRDHCVWREDGRWHHLVGAGLQDRGGCAVLYTSDDLRDWTYEGPALVADRVEPGVVWECPELLRFDGGDLLHVSDYSDVRYFVGAYDAADGTFDPDSEGLLDPGAFYAPQSMTAPDGRTLTFGWLQEERTVARQWDAGWAGALSLPRELAVVDGDVRQRPARELTALREATLFDGVVVADGETPVDARGEALELRARLDPEPATECGLVVRAHPDDEERTTLRLRDGELVVDRAASSLDPEARDDPVAVEVADLDRPLDLRVFLDGSVLEAFVNERRALTARIYPTRPESAGIRAYAEGGTVDVDLTVWSMGTCWSGELLGREPGSPTRTTE